MFKSMDTQNHLKLMKAKDQRLNQLMDSQFLFLFPLSSDSLEVKEALCGGTIEGSISKVISNQVRT